MNVENKQDTEASKGSAWKPFLEFGSPLTAFHSCNSQAGGSPLRNIAICRNEVDPNFYEQLIRDAADFSEQAASPGHSIVHVLDSILADDQQKARLKALTPHEIAMLGDYWTDTDLDRPSIQMYAN